VRFGRTRRSSRLLATALSVAVSVAALSQERAVVVGSGSTTPARLYEAWSRAFGNQNPAIQVHYLALSSSEGINEVSLGIGNFGAGEVPLTNQRLEGSRVPLVSVPTVLIAEVPIYNLPGNPTLNFSGDVLADIYLGNILNWRDPRIARLNPSLTLPDLSIAVVHRTPGKGSNFVFTDFLSKTNAQFGARVGKSASPHWPLGTEAETWQDMAKKVAATSGSIGYMELSFAHRYGIAYGRVQNASGRFVAATPASITAACTSSDQALDQSITNAPGVNSYPMASFSWIYVPTANTFPRRSALLQFLAWSLQEGQQMVTDSGYTPLPARVAAKALSLVQSLPERNSD